MKLQMIFRLLLPEPMVSPSQKQQISGHRTRSVLEQYNVVKDIDLRLLAQKQAEYLKAQSDATGTIAYLGTKKASQISRNLNNFNGGRCATRTRDLWFRRPTLYPTELIAHTIYLNFYQFFRQWSICMLLFRRA